MANKDAPFGFRPAKMLGGAPFNGGQTSYGIESGYSSKLISTESPSDGTLTTGSSFAVFIACSGMVPPCY